MRSGASAGGGVVWSPDGAKAAFWKMPDEWPFGRVYDATGKPPADLGRTAGVVAWSADGTDLYFATRAETPNEAKADRRWVGPASATTAAQATSRPWSDQ